ncbi:hypothetical protein QUF58_00390 [Anaerolineales bacterium HSG24]|nr:hypothetical protein [Anaerolineales bacterium HSG24]
MNSQSREPNAYPDSPDLHPNLLLGSLQLLSWLFYPTAWRSHVARIDPDLRPDFCLMELNREQWRSPVLRRMLIQGYIILPALVSLLIGLVLLSLSWPVEDIVIVIPIVVAFIVAFAVVVGVVGSVAVGVAGSVAIGVVFVVAFGMADTVAGGVVFVVAGAVAFGVAGTVAGGIANQTRSYSLIRQLGDVVVGIVTFVVMVVVMVVVAFDVADTVVGDVMDDMVAFGITFGVVLGMTVGLRTRNWRAGVAFGVMFVVVFSVAFGALGTYTEINVAGNVALGVVFAIVLGIVFGLAERIAGPWAGAIAGGLGGGGGWLAFWIAITIEELSLWPTLPLGLVGLLLGLTLALWRPVVLWVNKRRLVIHHQVNKTKPPSQMRPAEPTKDVFHLEEMVNEPDDLITASHITTWFYSSLNQPNIAVASQALKQRGTGLPFNLLSSSIKDIVISGHANSAICKEVSSKIFNAILEIDEANIKQTLIVTGAGLIRVKDDVQKPPSSVEKRRPRLRKKHSRTDKQLTPPLRNLQNDLSAVERGTGLAQVKTEQNQSYDDCVRAIRIQIQQTIKDNHNSPVLLHPAKGASAASGVILPFYQLRGPNLAPLQFTLSRSLLGSQFEELIEAHSHELREGMIEDAKRRLAIYEEWKKDDVRQLKGLLYRMMATVAAGGDIAALTEKYFQVLMKDKPLDFPIVSLRQQFKTTDFANTNIVQQRTERLTAFLQSNHFTLAPSALLSIQEPEYPIAGTRNYDDPYVQNVGEVTEYISLQELVEWHLPDMIGHNEDWIERMDDFLRKFDPEDPDYEGERLDTINTNVFLDSFLRGWPPVFLQQVEVREQYNQWVQQQRAVIWRKIHTHLRKCGINMLPLQADSVIFEVVEKGNCFVITPHYLTTTQTLATYLAPEMGIPYYINHWQHRERTVSSPQIFGNNRRLARKTYRKAKRHLSNGQFETALECFKQSLRIHPTWTAENLFSDSWKILNSDTDILLEHRLELFETMKLFDKNMEADLPKFKKGSLGFFVQTLFAQNLPESFNKLFVRNLPESLKKFNQQYPLFLPEPYVLLAYYEHAKNTPIQDIQIKMADLRQQADDILDQLVKDQVIILNEKTGEYKLNLHKEEAQRFAWGQQPILVNEETGEYYLNPLIELVKEQPTRLDQRDALLEQIKGLEQERDKLNRQIWMTLQRQANAPLRQAMMLDDKYVKQVLLKQNHQSVHSGAYKAHIAPLHILQYAHGCLCIEREVMERIYDKGGRDLSYYDQIKNDDNGKALRAVKKVVKILAEIKKNSDLETRDLDRLDNAIEHLDNYKTLDTLSKRNIQALIDRIRGHYLSEAWRGYQSAYKVVEINETRQQFSLCSYKQGQYRTALGAFRGNTQSPPMSSIPDTIFEVFKPDLTILPPSARIQLNKRNCTIDVISQANTSQPIIQYLGLSDEVQDHLASELERGGYVNRIKQTGLSPAYGVLLTPIARIPQALAWYRILESLEPWLIRVMAYSGLSPGPINPKYRKEALSAFDHTAIVETVIVEQEKAEQSALARFSNEYSTVEIERI